MRCELRKHRWQQELHSGCGGPSGRCYNLFCLPPKALKGNGSRLARRPRPVVWYISLPHPLTHYHAAPHRRLPASSLRKLHPVLRCPLGRPQLPAIDRSRTGAGRCVRRILFRLRRIPGVHGVFFRLFSGPNYHHLASDPFSLVSAMCVSVCYVLSFQPRPTVSQHGPSFGEFNQY